MIRPLPIGTHEPERHLPIRKLEIDSPDLIDREQGLLFTVGTLVNSLTEYELMIQSFQHKGFSSLNSEFIFIDNCIRNKMDAYDGLNRITNLAKGKYIILCDQGIRLHADNIDILIGRLEQLEEIDKNWAVAGNSGGASEGVKSQRISDIHGYNRTIGTFPCRVYSLDENFIVMRRSKRFSLSNDIRGFHFYGTDVCVVADIIGYSSYVIDFHLLNLNPKKIDPMTLESKNSFERKWSNAIRPRAIQTSCTIVDIETPPEVKPKWLKTTSQTKAQIFQIFYDEKTKSMVSPDFIPLDNLENLRPDWFEFHVIRKTLKNLEMQKDSFYGFLSPNFSQKTGMSPSEVIEVIRTLPKHVEVVLLTSKSHDLVLFQNIFLQGDYSHPGLLQACEVFFDFIGKPINLRELVTTLDNSVASNYIIAKPIFWRQWLDLADLFFNYVENEKLNNPHNLKNPTGYKGKYETELKVFVQERLATFLLATENFETYVPNHFKKFKTYDNETRVTLKFLESLKSAFAQTGDARFIDEYQHVLHEGSLRLDSRIQDLSYIVGVDDKQ